MKGSDRELIEKLMGTLQRMRLDEYVEHVQSRKRLIWDNLFYGMVRGVGFSFGFTVLGAAMIVLFKNVLSDNIPLLGGFIAEVIHEIEARM
jgi:hypothetical protein